MHEDPIVAEVRQARAAHAAEFNNDLLAIYRDLKRQERKNRRRLVNYPARRIQPTQPARSKVSPAP
jgi:hypothetical protein